MPLEVKCPGSDCDVIIPDLRQEVEDGKITIGHIIYCDDCGDEFEVLSINPLQFSSAIDTDEDEEDEDFQDDDTGEDDDE